MILSKPEVSLPTPVRAVSIPWSMSWEILAGAGSKYSQLLHACLSNKYIAFYQPPHKQYITFLRFSDLRTYNYMTNLPPPPPPPPPKKKKKKKKKIKNKQRKTQNKTQPQKHVENQEEKKIHRVPIFRKITSFHSFFICFISQIFSYLSFTVFSKSRNQVFLTVSWFVYFWETTFFKWTWFIDSSGIFLK